MVERLVRAADRISPDSGAKSSSGLRSLVVIVEGPVDVAVGVAVGGGGAVACTLMLASVFGVVFRECC